MDNLIGNYLYDAFINSHSNQSIVTLIGNSEWCRFHCFFVYLGFDPQNCKLESPKNSMNHVRMEHDEVGRCWSDGHAICDCYFFSEFHLAIKVLIHSSQVTWSFCYLICILSVLRLSGPSHLECIRSMMRREGGGISKREIAY